MTSGSSPPGRSERGLVGRLWRIGGEDGAQNVARLEPAMRRDAWPPSGTSKRGGQWHRNLSKPMLRRTLCSSPMSGLAANRPSRTTKRCQSQKVRPRTMNRRLMQRDWQPNRPAMLTHIVSPPSPDGLANRPAETVRRGLVGGWGGW
jgi:hypothetical protein